MKKKALIKDITREIWKTRNRFISLLLITMLGVAFFAGVRASEPDMQLSGDKFYDATNLMDIRVLSTLGLTEEDVEAIAAVDGVGEAVGSYSADVLSDLPDQQIVLKFISDTKTINEIQIVDGRMPESKTECLVDANFLDTTDYEIGDTISIYASGEDELDDTMEEDRYTIVGSGNSSYYMSLDRGSSTIGSGSVYAFVVVPEEAFSLDAYTEVYATAEGARELISYTDAYDDLTAEVAESIEEIEAQRAQIRYDEIIEEANQEIADAEQEIADAEQELADAAQELEDGKQELADAWEEFYEGEAELEDARKEIADAEQELTDGQKEIDDGWAEIRKQQKELDSGKSQLSSARTQLEAGRKELEEGRAAYESGKKQLEEGEAQITELKEQLAGIEQMLEAAGEEEVDEILLVQAEMLRAGIAQGEAELEAPRAELAAAAAELSKAEATISAGEQEINANQAKISSGESAIASAKQELASAQTKIDDGRKELEEGKQELADGEAELEDARRELEDAEQELADGEQEYLEALEENEPKIADAKQDIADAKETLEDLELPEWFVLDRQYLQTYVEYGQNAERIGAIGKVFPLIFFLVAALVCLTTMTRMVEEQRTQIGSLKALGYSKVDIAAKYILYGLLASLSGSLIGLVIGQKTLPVFIINAYKILYNVLPEVYSPLYVSHSVSATAAAVLCVTIATVFACYKETLSVPAQLMRPVAPKSGKRILLERIGFLWKRFNFSKKATARNLFRYKKRFFMTLFGIGGCMALIIVGFGLKDSIVSIGELQFTNVRIYDSGISLADDLTEVELEEILAVMEEDEDIVRYTAASQEAVDAAKGSVEKSAYLIVPQNPGELREYISLQSRTGDEQYELGRDGVIITEKLATLLDVQAGDTIELKEDETDRVEVTVDAVAENYFFHYVYMSEALYEKLYGEAPTYDNYFTVNKDNSEEFEKNFSSRYLEYDQVTGIDLVSDTAESIEDMLGSMDSIIWILTFSAGLLAFIVLYNLNNINISERLRELATLKVLGFYDGEVSGYMLRENIWLTLFGMAAGVVIGKVLHYFVILTAEVDMTMFGREIKWQSYIYSMILTFAFSAFVNLVMHYKLKKVNMVESMKSVE